VSSVVKGFGFDVQAATSKSLTIDTQRFPEESVNELFLRGKAVPQVLRTWSNRKISHKLLDAASQSTNIRDNNLCRK